MRGGERPLRSPRARRREARDALLPAVSRAWKRSNHTDPGRAYPLRQVLARAEAIIGTRPPPKPVAKPRPTLERGDTGWRVKQLQRLLNGAPGFSLEVDGIFGDKTAHAVTRFQRRRGIVPDGVVGPVTWAALLR